jgi:phosphoglycolate phosphatase
MGTPGAGPYDLIVFDLDGTLVDSAPDIVASLQRALERLGREVIPADRIVAAIGRGLRKLVEDTSAPPYEPVMEAYMEEYEAHPVERTRLYPGVAETLPQIGARKVVLSNKPLKLVQGVLEALNVAAHFEALYGGDSFPVHKPDVEVFRRATRGARRVLVVGDSGVDVAMARNAGVPVCAVTYGYQKPGELDGADYRIDRFDQILDLLR